MAGDYNKCIMILVDRVRMANVDIAVTALVIGNIVKVVVKVVMVVMLVVLLRQ